MSQHEQQIAKQKKQSPQFRFNKYEIIFLLAFIIVHQIIIAKMVIDYSNVHPQQTSPSYLSDFIGKNRDSHDVQWQTYRSNLPVLALCMLIWWGVSSLIEKYPNEKSWLLGGIILAYSFRSDLLIYFAILSGWYLFSTYCYKFKYFISICWIICIVLLYINELTAHFNTLSLFIGDLVPEWISSKQRQISCGQVLNMTFLKLLSFAIDISRSNQQRQLEKHLDKCEECRQGEYCLKGRNFIDTDDFTFKSYMNYVLFAPTLLTGPPIAYKNFISFQKMPTSKKPEIGRCIFLLISFQIYQHYFPVIPLTSTQSFVQAEVFALFHLVFIWFKFLIIWRVGRVWAAICGIAVVDNLSRCVCNNYGFEGFWRMWHRGFNQWLIRYLYIPLGGNKNLLAVVAVIAFVAFWHDHTLNIVIWAFALVLFILPEILIKRYARSSLRSYYKFHWFKYFSALISAIYIYCLVFSNIIGFGYGSQKLYLIWQRVQQQWMQLIWSLIVITCAVILMFYQRANQKDNRNY